MKKLNNSYARILLALVGLLALGAAAHASIRPEAIVTLPFEFVVSGQTLPAGTYTLSRFSDDRFDGLILFNHEHHISVFVHPVAVASASSDMPQVSFEQVGNQRFLSRIQTSHDIFELAVSRSVILEAAAKQAGHGPVSGNSAGH